MPVSRVLWKKRAVLNVLIEELLSFVVKPVDLKKHLGL